MDNLELNLCNWHVMLLHDVAAPNGYYGRSQIGILFGTKSYAKIDPKDHKSQF